MARIYGLFTIATEVFNNIDVIVMQNTSKFKNQTQLKYKFDLKGSRINRYVKFDAVRAGNIEMSRLGNDTFRMRQSEIRGSVNIDNLLKNPISKKVLKDNNFIELEKVFHQNGMTVLNIPGMDQIRLRKALKSDSLFLKKHNLMDYSLYLAVEKYQNRVEQSSSLNNSDEYDAIQRNIITS